MQNSAKKCGLPIYYYLQLSITIYSDLVLVALSWRPFALPRVIIANRSSNNYNIIIIGPFGVIVIRGRGSPLISNLIKIIYATPPSKSDATSLNITLARYSNPRPRARLYSARFFSVPHARYFSVLSKRKRDCLAHNPAHTFKRKSCT